ncbi:MAG: amidohydrolase family protein, partial [Acidobacteria bacterium]|nr:amidohydrolase family protein [Acidobacteriota bacterium]
MWRSCWKGANAFCLVIGLLSLGIRQHAWAQIYADMVFYNGKVLTADTPDPNNFSTAQAVAILGDRIVGVGTSQDMLKLAGPDTRRFDLEGRTVIPGRIDTHTHDYNYAARIYLGYSENGGRPDTGFTDAVLWSGKDDGLAQLRSIVMSKKPGEWAVVHPNFTEQSGWPNSLGANFPPPFLETITLADLDRVAPNTPLVLSRYTAQNGSLVNSVALKALLDRYPNIRGVKRDQDGKPTGWIDGTASVTLQQNLWSDPDKAWLAGGIHKYLEHHGADGVTTISTRVIRHALDAFRYLESKGQMPVRLGFNTEATLEHPDPEMIMRRYDMLPGDGTPMIWNTGHALMAIDNVEGAGTACVSKEYPREVPEFPNWRFGWFGPYGNCHLADPLHSLKEQTIAVVKAGGRLGAIHAAGDKGIDQFFDIIEPLAEQYNVKEMRYAIDHCRMIRKDQIERAKKFDIAFSCGMPLSRGYGDERTATEVLFGPEGAEMRTPLRSMIDAGLRPSLETDTPDFYSFLATEQIVTRKYPNGKILGPNQRINRREGLYASTRWAAAYVWKEKELGSIEVGKYADLVVLDRDYLPIPEDDISEINVLLTLLGGKPVYTEPKFATAKGLPVMGFQDLAVFFR